MLEVDAGADSGARGNCSLAITGLSVAILLPLVRVRAPMGELAWLCDSLSGRSSHALWDELLRLDFPLRRESRLGAVDLGVVLMVDPGLDSMEPFSLVI